MWQTIKIRSWECSLLQLPWLQTSGFMLSFLLQSSLETDVITGVKAHLPSSLSKGCRSYICL